MGFDWWDPHNRRRYYKEKREAAGKSIRVVLGLGNRRLCNFCFNCNFKFQIVVLSLFNAVKRLLNL